MTIRRFAVSSASVKTNDNTQIVLAFHAVQRKSLAAFCSWLSFSLPSASVRPRALADTAPDWLHAAARETMPPTTKDAVAVILLDEQITTVKDNGEIETTYRRAYKILRPEGRKMYGAVDIYFDKETRITFHEGVGDSGGRQRIPSETKGRRRTGRSTATLFTAISVERSSKFPAANPGNVIGYEYSQKQRPFLFADIWDFQDIIPVRRARFTLQLPPGWQMSHAMGELSRAQRDFDWK